jgi:YceI-like protein
MTDLLTRTQLTGDYTVDTVHSRLGFIARHAMVTKVRGSFRSFTGELHIDGADPSNSRGSIRIDVATSTLVEVDEYQHFTTFRRTTLDLYPPECPPELRSRPIPRPLRSMVQQGRPISESQSCPGVRRSRATAATRVQRRST